MVKAILMLLFVATFGSLAVYLRGRGVGEGGALLLRVTRPPIRVWTLLLLALAGFYLILVVMALYQAMVGSIDYAKLGPALIPGLCMLTVTLAPAIFSRGAHLEVRERGILVGPSFWPWAKSKGFSWKGNGDTVRLNLAGYGWVEYRIKAEQKGSLNELLAQHVNEPFASGIAAEAK